MKSYLPSFSGRRTRLHQLPRTYLNYRLAMMLIVGEVLLGTGGFMYIEGYTLLEGFYMTIITISTVGYTEVRALTDGGRMFSSFLIILNIGIFAYVLSVFSYYVISGEFLKSLHLRMIGNQIENLKDHVIICGHGRYGSVVCTHFSSQNTPYVVVEIDNEVIREIQRSEQKILYLEGDATQDEVLQAAGIEKAKALISALADDAENLYVVLTARQLNPGLDIISRATNTKAQDKLRLAGANHVVMPEQIGGFYMAALVSKPDATEFFSYITSDLGSEIEFEEFPYEDLPDSLRGKPIRDLGIREKTGTSIIALKHGIDKFTVNPSPDTVLTDSCSCIVLGTRSQLDGLRNYLKNLS